MGRFLSRQSVLSFNYGIKSIVERSGADVNYKIKSGCRCALTLALSEWRPAGSSSAFQEISPARGRRHFTERPVFLPRSFGPRCTIGAGLWRFKRWHYQRRRHTATLLRLCRPNWQRYRLTPLQIGAKGSGAETGTVVGRGGHHRIASSGACRDSEVDLKQPRTVRRQARIKNFSGLVVYQHFGERRP